MRNVALKLMYNGTAYHGWQVQKTEITVAETLEKALATICGHPVKVTGCGRPDAGVHAEHYIAPACRRTLWSAGPLTWRTSSTPSAPA